MSEEITKLKTTPASPRLDNENTIFFETREEGSDAKTGRTPAQIYFAQKYPKSEAFLVSEIDLAALHDKHVIVLLLRGLDKTPLQEAHFDLMAKNQYRTKVTPAAEVVGEVVECEPIFVRDYWIKPAHRGAMGHVDHAGIYSAIAAQSIPLGHRPRPGSGDTKMIFTSV
jgi:hypothetical protein